MVALEPVRMIVPEDESEYVPFSPMLMVLAEMVPMFNVRVLVVPSVPTDISPSANRLRMSLNFPINCERTCASVTNLDTPVVDKKITGCRRGCPLDDGVCGVGIGNEGIIAGGR